MILTLLALIGPLSAKKEKPGCPEGKFPLKGKCKKLTGFAANYPNLAADAVSFAYSYTGDLEFPRKAYKNMSKFKKRLQANLATESLRQTQGKESCLKENISDAQLQAIRSIPGNDLKAGNNYGRIDYAEMYLENLLHLLFTADSKHRIKLQNSLDKAFAPMEAVCGKWCDYFGYDYFFFYPANGNPADNFQAYYSGVHQDAMSTLGASYENDEITYID